jgi:hypothetical protein
MSALDFMRSESIPFSHISETNDHCPLMLAPFNAGGCAGIEPGWVGAFNWPAGGAAHSAAVLGCCVPLLFAGAVGFG